MAEVKWPNSLSSWPSKGSHSLVDPILSCPILSSCSSSNAQWGGTLDTASMSSSMYSVSGWKLAATVIKVLLFILLFILLLLKWSVKQLAVSLDKTVSWWKLEHTFDHDSALYSALDFYYKYFPAAACSLPLWHFPHISVRLFNKKNVG